MRQTQITLALLSLSLSLPLVEARAASSQKPAPSSQEAAPASKESAPAQEAQASQSREAAAYAAFEKSLGADILSLLDSLKHAVVVEYAKGDRRLLQVQWAALEPVAAHAADLVAMADLYQAARNGDKLPSADLKPLRTVQSMEPAGLVTSAVKAAADVLAVHLATLASMGGDQAAQAKDLLFDKSWARGFLDRIHAGLQDDFRPFASEYFSLFLAVPGEPEPVRHFLAHAGSLAPEVSKLLAEDRTAGKPSERLQAELASYLLDQKRLWTLSQTRRRLKALERSTDLRRELKDLRTVALGLKSPDVLSELRRAFEAPAAGAKTPFNGPELHVQALGGDKVVLSAAYWVEGLPAGGKTPVTETAFVDAGGPAVSHRSQQTVSRAAGGPYTFSAELALDSDQPAVFRLVLGSPAGAVFSREARLDAVRGPQAAASAFGLDEAESLAQECRFEEAGKALKTLSDRLAAEGTADPARKSALEAHSGTIQAQLALLNNLEQALPGARLYASPEQCQYTPAKAQFALSLLKRLPPGCDRSPLAPGGILSEELRDLAETAARRRNLQEAFRTGAAAARRLEDSCKFDEAARRYASALSLLDSDAGARCGAWEQEHSRIRVEDLPRAIRASGRASSLDRTLEAAAKKLSKGDYTGALETAAPVLAAVSSMPSGSCYSSQKEKAAGLVEAAGVALGPAPAESLLSSLPADPAAKEAAEVRAEHEALLRARAERQKAQQVPQAPLSPGRDSIQSGGGQ